MFDVAIITRTKNRPQLLARALSSVAGQTFANYVWVIINDGGEKSAVEDVFEQAKQKGVEVRLLHNETSQGMEAASNKAINSVESTYIVIHDDDDTWEPEFLAKCVAKLREDSLHGVVTHSKRVDETVTGNNIKHIRSYGFNTGIQQIAFSEILKKNIFTTISFVFSREAYNNIGGFDESLEVLGDWDFNLRFSSRYHICLIPEALANYHHRRNIANPTDACGNTVITTVDKHLLHRQKIIDKYLRDSLSDKQFDIGLMLQAAQLHMQMEQRFSHSIFFRTDALISSFIIKLLKRLGLTRLLGNLK